MRNQSWIKYVFIFILTVVTVFIGLMGYQIYLIQSKKTQTSNLLKLAFQNMLTFLGISNGDSSPAKTTVQTLLGNVTYAIKKIIAPSTVDDIPTNISVVNPVTNPTTPPTSNEELILFAFAGESNAGNQVHNDHASPGEIGVRNIKILNNSSLVFEALNIGVNNSIDQNAAPANSHGWDLGLANLADAGSFSGKKVFLVNLSQGGSFIGHYGVGVDTNYRNKINSRANAAMSALGAISSNIKVYMVYSQGINDELLGTGVDSWKSQTINHLSFMNGIFGGNMKVVITKFGAFLKYNQAIQEIANGNGNYRALETIGLSLQDDVHWGYASQKTNIANAVNILKNI